MKSYQSIVTLFAVAALAQNEIPQPGVTPERYWVQDPSIIDPRVVVFTNEIALVNASTIALDQAIYDAQDASGVAPALAAATSLIAVIQAQAQDATTHPVIDIDTTTDEGAVLIGPLLDYTFSLFYHVNHTVNDVVAKEDLVVKYCQGPVVSSLIGEITNQARTLVSNIIDKVPEDLKTDAPFVTGGIFSALSTAASAYADQSTTSPGCTPISTSGLPTSTGTTGTATTTGGSGSTTGGSTPTTTGGNSGWSNYGTTAAPTYAPSTYKPTGSSSDDCEDDTPSTYAPSTYKPTGSPSTTDDCEDDTPSTYKPTVVPSTYKPTPTPDDDCEDDTPTPKPSTYKPTTYKPSGTPDDDCEDDTPTPKPTTYKASVTGAPPVKQTTTGGAGGVYTTKAAATPTGIKTYPGAGVANKVCVGTVVFAALAAFLL